MFSRPFAPFAATRRSVGCAIFSWLRKIVPTNYLHRPTFTFHGPQNVTPLLIHANLLKPPKSPKHLVRQVSNWATRHSYLTLLSYRDADKTHNLRPVLNSG